MMEIVQVMVLSVVSGFLGWINHELGKAEEKIQTNKRAIEKIEVKLDFLKEGLESMEEHLEKLDDKIDIVLKNCALLKRKDGDV